MKKKSIALTLTAVMLALAVGIGGTIAYFTAKTDDVVNTFTTSSGIDIKLDEAKVGEDWKAITGEGATRVTSNTYNNIVPGAELDKDPTVTVNDGSDDAYIAVKVVVSKAEAWKDIVSAQKNNLTYATLKASLFNGLDTANSWKEIQADDATMTYVYMWKGAVDGVVSANNGYTLFNKVVIPSTLDNGEMNSIKDFKITVTAYAVQAQGVSVATAETELINLANK